MDDPIVQSREMVTLVGASATDPDVLAESLALAPVLVAADGGAGVALANGHMPVAVIGDFDSADPGVLAQVPAGRVHRIAEQDSTDFDKAVRHIAAPLVLAVGFTGQRLDHELAVYNALVRHAARRVIVVGAEDICFHAPPVLRLALEPGCRVSLFPMAEIRCASEGLRWATDDLVFAPWARVGTSNLAETGPVVLRPAAPGMLAILPRAALRAATRALAAA